MPRSCRRTAPGASTGWSRSARCWRAGARQPENDRGPTAVPRLRPQIAAMRLGELARDREPQAGALLFGGEEWGKDGTTIGLRNAGAPVRHGDLRDSVVEAGADRHLAGRGRGID